MISTTVLLLFLLAADRLTKIFLSEWLADNGSIEIIPKVLRLYLLPGGNEGAAFGLLEGKTVLLSIITGVALLAMLYILYIKRLHSKVLHIALVLIVAGGAGNLFDRVAYGRVTDFFEFVFVRFPVFNVADCCITVGAVLAIFYLIFISKSDEPIFEQKN